MPGTDPIIEPGRSRDTGDDLDRRARMRLEHAGRWAAWSADGRRIVAAGDGPEDARAAAERAGFSRFILDWIPPIDERQAGA